MKATELNEKSAEEPNAEMSNLQRAKSNLRHEHTTGQTEQTDK